MDFRKLSHNDFEEFLRVDFSEYGVHNDKRLQDLDQVEKKYQQLKSIPGVVLPLPVQDLEIYTQCPKRFTEIYTSEHILNLGSKEISPFIKEFGLPPLSFEINQRRILRIMSYQGLIEDLHYILLTPPVLDELSSTLPIDDLATFQMALNVQQLDCRVQIQDSNNQITIIQGFRHRYKGIIESIARNGSTRCFLLYLKNNLVRNITLMLNWDYDVNQRDSRGKTALFKLVKYGKLELVRVLLSHGANPNIKDNNGCSVLFEACKDGDLEIIRDLLKYKADPNCPGIVDIQTPLIVAASGGYLGNFNSWVQQNYATEEAFLIIITNHVMIDTLKRVANKHGWTDIIEFLNTEITSQTQLRVEWLMIIKKYEPTYFKIVKLLIEAGARYNNDMLPSVSASRIGFMNIYNFLIQLEPR